MDVPLLQEEISALFDAMYKKDMEKLSRDNAILKEGMEMADRMLQEMKRPCMRFK